MLRTLYIRPGYSYQSQWISRIDIGQNISIEIPEQVTDWALPLDVDFDTVYDVVFIVYKPLSQEVNSYYVVTNTGGISIVCTSRFPYINIYPR